MDATHNLMVVAHQAVIRCLFSFFFRTPAEKIPYEKIPLHCLMKITWNASTGKNEVDFQSFGIESVDTYRPKVDAKELQTTTSETTSPSKTRSFNQNFEAGGKSKLIA